MNLALSALIVAVCVTIAVAAMLLVRRNAPEGSHFADGDRAAGVFGVLASGFAVLLGFVVFLAFTSYDTSRAGAESEALVLAQQFETAQFLPDGVGRRLGDELVCYGRSVVHQEWPRLEEGGASNAINPWGAAMFKTLMTADSTTATEQSAFDKWLDQTSDREAARNDRIRPAEGVLPGPLWWSCSSSPR